jgi:sterol desaturase/sphingolipid hydroxylase (fatty acid hydroxylase superfamily)
MQDFILAHEQWIRLFWFVLGVLLFARFERHFPRRSLHEHRSYRWLNNFSLVVMGTIALRLAFPLLAVGVALEAGRNGWGLMRQLSTPLWLEVPISIVLLDGIIYFQHVLVHRIPLLWRLHRVHHTDTDLDVSSALRFHPIEILLSMLIKIVAVVLFGISPVAVILFEVILNFSAMFNHANWNIGKWDAVLAKLIVTPDMHRVHHSTRLEESNSNFGFFLSIWDRIFATYKSEPREGQLNFKIGTEIFRSYQDQRIDQLLIQPFRSSSNVQDLTD